MFEFDFSLLLHGQYHEMLVASLLLSPKLAAVTLVFTVPLTVLVALLYLMPFRTLQQLGFAYVESIHNTPLLARILFWYFAAPERLPEDLKAWLYAGSIEVASAIVALTLYTAAFMGEDIHSDIRAVSAVQLEAARTLGFGYLASMRLVILPQALRVTVPPLILQVLNLWKNTSVTTMIGVAKLMYQTGQMKSSTFRSFESFTLATTAYLSVSLLVTGATAQYQQHYPGVERR